MSDFKDKPERAGFITRTTEVKLNVSLDALDDIVSIHHMWMSQGINNQFPVSVEDYIEYCRSLMASKINLVARKTSPSQSYREAVMPAFLENFICRIGTRYYPDLGVTITWNPVSGKFFSDQKMNEISMKLAGVRKVNIDLVFDGYDGRLLSGLDNGYIVDGDSVYSLGGTDPKGYQLAAALSVTPDHEHMCLLFRKNLCSSTFARQEVLNAFG